MLLGFGAAVASPTDDLLAARFTWKCGAPLVAPAVRPQDPCFSVKDPSIVFFGDRWHLFCTIRSRVRSHQIEYLSFADWVDAKSAEHRVMKLSDGYFCAPQVFYFTPQRKWYMILQINDASRKPSLQPAWSVTEDVANPDSWSKPTLLFAQQPANVSHWIDFWVICDERRAHLFFTSNDGHMWRSETKRAEFPGGWSQPKVVLEADVFEASHTYKMKGLSKFLTIIEAQGHGRRYYKAYLADQLDGKWEPLADTQEHPFAGAANVHDTAGHWADSISHGELLRDGYDEHLVADPSRIRLLFQGVTDEAMRGKTYGEIPWRLGILEPEFKARRDEP